MKNNSYEYRNLPCTAGEWAVVGEDRVMRAGGVLEWCWDEQDALERMVMMHRDPRFVNLAVEKRESR